MIGRKERKGKGLGGEEKVRGKKRDGRRKTDD